MAVQKNHKYARIAESLRQRILNGKFDEGELLPTTKMLAEEFGTTPVTIDKAIGELVSEGLVVRTPGVGTAVRSKPDVDTESGVAGKRVGALLQAQTESKFWERLIEGVNDILRPESCSLLVGYHKQDLDVAIQQAELFMQQGCEVCLFAPFDRPDVSMYESDNARMVEKLRSLGMEVIMLDRYIESVPGHFVSEYCYSMGTSMMEKVIDMGFSNPLCLSTDYVSVIGARERAFVEGCRNSGIEDPESRIERLPLAKYQNRDYDAIIELLSQHKDTDIIVSLNSRIFNTLFYALARTEHSPLAQKPHFAGFVDIELIDLERVVAYVEQPVRDMGHAAGRMVKHVLTERSLEYRHSLVPCELRILG